MPYRRDSFAFSPIRCLTNLVLDRRLARNLDHLTWFCGAAGYYGIAHFLATGSPSWDVCGTCGIKARHIDLKLISNLGPPGFDSSSAAIFCPHSCLGVMSAILKSVRTFSNGSALSPKVGQTHIEKTGESNEDWEALHEYYTKYPNTWSRIRLDQTLCYPCFMFMRSPSQRTIARACCRDARDDDSHPIRKRCRLPSCSEQQHRCLADPQR